MFHVKHRALAVAAAAVITLTGCGTVAAPSGWAGPVASANNLVVVQDKPGQIVALNPKDGTEAWRYPDTAKPASGGGINSRKITGALYASPVINGTSIYLVSYEGHVTRLDTQGGGPAIAGEVDLPKDTTVVATPRIRGDRLYVFAEDGRVYALNTNNLSTVATYRPTDGRVWGSPALQGSTLYIGTLDSSNLVALNADTGATDWKQKLAGASAASVGSDGDLLVVASFDRAVHGFDAANKGAERWRFAGDGWFVSTPLVTKTTIYAASMGGSVYAIDKSGKELWHRNWAGKEFRSALILSGDTLVAVSRDGVAYGLNLADGTERWTKATSASVDADGLLLESNLFYITTAHSLLRIDPTNGAVQTFNTQPPTSGK